MVSVGSCSGVVYNGISEANANVLSDSEVYDPASWDFREAVSSSGTRHLLFCGVSKIHSAEFE